MTRDNPSPMYPSQEDTMGYPTLMLGQVASQDKEGGLVDYMKANPHVAGMAWGAGLNGSDPNSGRSIVVNPFNKMMYLPENRNGLQMIEAARHKMSETNYNPGFSITPEMQAYRNEAYKSTDPYLNDDLAFKQSLVSRALVGDLPSQYPMTAVESAANKFKQQYFPANRLSP